MQVETAPANHPPTPTPATPGSPPPETERDPWPIVVLALALAVIVLNAARSPFDSDTWWHLRSGELILDRGSLPSEDPFAWTAAGDPWRINSWLFDVLAAASRSVAGTGPLIALTLLAAAGFGVACYLLARRAGARPWPSVAVATTFTVLLTRDVAERPQIISYLLFAVALVVAPRALAGSNRALAALAVLIALWANLHFAFIAGVLVVMLLAGAAAIQEHRFRRAAVVGATCIVAGLLTPFGLGAYRAAFQTRGTSDLINEWQSVTLTQPRDVFLVVVVLLTGVSMWRTGRWRHLAYVLPVAVFGALTLDAIRNASFLFLVAAGELALGCSALPLRRVREWPRLRRMALVHGLVLGLTIMVVVGLPALGNARPTAGDTYPIRATAAIPDGCRVLNEYIWGGYITDMRWPDVLVSQDGRNGNEQGLARQRSALLGEPGALEWIDRNDVDCVVAKRDRPLLARLRAEGWRQTATDPTGVLLVRP
ncbi:MAG: hypothetical protein ACRDZV_02265 [Acidimicrobiia bacterium]